MFGHLDLAYRKMRRRWRARAVRRTFRRVHGPARFRLKRHEVAVVLMGRDVGYFLDGFVQHHRAMGADYLIYVDNGSRDDSVARAMAYDRTIVAVTDAQFRTHETWMRYLAATLYATGGWRLALDADELLDYPGRARIPLPDLVARLAARGQTGAVGQMLEMVPAGPLPETESFEAAVAAFDHASLEDVSALPYHDARTDLAALLAGNRLASEAVRLLFGGIRRTLFGEDCLLTKHPLFRPGLEVRPLLHPHVTVGLTVSDMTLLIRHYKFAGDYLARERRLRAERRLAHGEGALRLRRFDAEPELSFAVPGLRRAPSVEELAAADFLALPPAARRMLDL